jgi:hypothetical protein
MTALTRLKLTLMPALIRLKLALMPALIRLTLTLMPALMRLTLALMPAETAGKRPPLSLVLAISSTRLDGRTESQDRNRLGIA